MCCWRLSVNLKRSSRRPLPPSNHLSFISHRSKRVADANNDAQQDLNRFLKEFNEKYTIEETQVRWKISY